MLFLIGPTGAERHPIHFPHFREIVADLEMTQFGAMSLASLFLETSAFDEHLRVHDRNAEVLRQRRDLEHVRRLQAQFGAKSECCTLRFCFETSPCNSTN